MTTLERAARALEESLGPCLDRMITDRDDLDKAVRAVLKVIRDPGQEVSGAAADKAGQMGTIREWYVAMIDAMLAEKG